MGSQLPVNQWASEQKADRPVAIDLPTRVSCFCFEYDSRRRAPFKAVEHADGVSPVIVGDAGWPASFTWNNYTNDLESPDSAVLCATGSASAALRLLLCRQSKVRPRDARARIVRR